MLNTNWVIETSARGGLHRVRELGRVSCLYTGGNAFYRTIEGKPTTSTPGGGGSDAPPVFVSSSLPATTATATQPRSLRSWQTLYSPVPALGHGRPRGESCLARRRARQQAARAAKRAKSSGRVAETPLHTIANPVRCCTTTVNRSTTKSTSASVFSRPNPSRSEQCARSSP